MKKNIIRALFLAFVGFTFFDVSGQSVKTVSTSVENFVQNLGMQAVKIAGTKNLSDTKKVSQFHELLTKSYAVKSIGFFTLGRFSRGLDPHLLERFFNVFSNYIVNTYYTRFKHYTDLTFRVTKVRTVEENKRYMVTSVLTKNDDHTQINVVWSVAAASKDQFKVLDVIVEGISMSQSQRDEFVSFVQSNDQDVEALVELLEERVRAAA